MAVRSLKTRDINIFLPGDPNVYYKIQIVADDDTVYTVADTYGGAVTDNYTISANTTRPVSDRLGSFKIRLSNDEGRWLDVFDGGELIKFYADNTDATTLVFAGLVDDIKFGLNNSDGFFCEIDGRAYPELVDKTITGQEIAATADVGIAGILDEFYSDVAFLFWNGSSWSEATYDEASDTVTWSPTASNFPETTINTSYQNKKGWTVIKELLGRAGLDGYMEYDESTPRWTLRTFVQEDIVNTNATIAYGVNLISMGDYGTDNSEIYNRVIAYGATESDNILLLKTEEDTDSQSNFWIKDKIVQDTSLNTMDEVEQTAEYELSLGLDNVANGRVTIICNPTLKPGEMVECSVPYCGFNGLHKIQKYTHNFGNTVTTSIEVSKKIKTLKDIFVEKVNPDDYINTSPNINNMRDSYTIYFNESPSRMNLDADTEISDGKLKLKSGSSTGTATSLQLTTDYDVTECELRRFENYATDDDTIEVSNDGGINWESLDKTSGNVHEFSVPGNKIMFRINMSNANGDPQYESICMLYK